MRNDFGSSLGFTLIELMMVLAIIGVLAAIALPQFMLFLAKSRQSEGRLLAKGVYVAEISYYADHESFGLGAGGINSFLAFEAKTGFQPAQPPKFYTDLQVLSDDPADPNIDFFAMVSAPNPGVDRDPHMDRIAIHGETTDANNNSSLWCLVGNIVPCASGIPLHVDNDVLK